MPNPIGNVGLDPFGQDVVVTITPATHLFTDEQATEAAVFPMTINDVTRFWATAAGQLRVSALLNGVEIAGTAGDVMVVEMAPGVGYTFGVGVNPGEEAAAVTGSKRDNYALAVTAAESGASTLLAWSDTGYVFNNGLLDLGDPTAPKVTRTGLFVVSAGISPVPNAPTEKCFVGLALGDGTSLVEWGTTGFPTSPEVGVHASANATQYLMSGAVVRAYVTQSAGYTVDFSGSVSVAFLG